MISTIVSQLAQIGMFMLKVLRFNPEFRILRLESQPQNTELGRLNSFSDLFLVCLKTIDLLNLIFLLFCGHIASLKF